jgi:membrane protease YdiL (CAAX protease family)
MRAYRVYGSLMAAWIAAWLLKVSLDPRAPGLATDLGGFLYWTTAKAIIWILPAVWLIRASGRTVREVFNVPRWRRWLAWGGGIGLAVALAGWLPKAAAGQPLFGSAIGVPLLNSFIVAPLFEEFLIRGAMLGSLQQVMPFWRANLIAALMFLGLHLPGWYFMGSLAANMARPIGGGLSIFLLGLAFGYAAYRGQSVLGGSLAHLLNNFAAA